jgi:hypothetical protein
MRWFRPFGIVFVPVSLAGWIVTLLAAAFCAQVFLAVDLRSHSVSDTLYGIFPFWTPTFLLWVWLAGRLCGSRTSPRP